MRVRRTVVVVALALCAGAAAAPARAERIQPLKPNARPSGSALLGFRDRVIDRRPRAAAALSTRAATRTYTTPDGIPIEVTTSPSVSGSAQSYVDFLGSRLHGDELTLLRVYIGTPAEISRVCGGGAEVLACYARLERRMYVPDREPNHGGPFTREYAITHEYGHHIASFRSNFPFSALDWGAKYWASYEHVCAGVTSRLLYPGNQDAHYLDDPGEGFADTYAHLHYPLVLWQFSDLLRPDDGAFAAIRRDVLDPWRVPVRRRLRARLGPARRTAQTRVRATLDGQLAVRLQSPRGARYDLELRNHGRLLRRVGGRARSKRATATICRDATASTASADLRVVRRAGSGRFTLTYDYPG
jgi:hypothetical protein